MEQPPSTEKTGPQKGDVIDGKLEIEGVIAEGRTSTVVSAVDRGNGGKKIAVKIARGSDLESVERFKRAARGMAKLTSPYVVKVFGVGTTQDGAPCMTMEYLEGRTLAQKITQSGPLPVHEARQLMLQVCDAIADAHAQKLLHRDLDAENLFLAMPALGSGGQPSVRVLDFGLAPVWRLGKGDGRLRPGDVPGTSFAMAPELARGSDLDERVDVWGIGACLYRLLTNKHPYNARNLAELCTRILSDRPPDVARARPEVTPGLAAVVKKCLEREPADRYRTVREVITALEATEDEAPHTPQVHTEKATLDQLRALEKAAEEMRMTPMVFRAAAEHAADAELDRITDPGAIPSSNDDDFEGATAMYKKSDLAAAVAEADAKPATDFKKTVPKEPTTLEPQTVPKTIPKEPATLEPPTTHFVAKPIVEEGGEIGAATPQTMRIVPAFEAIAARLEPPKPKYRTDPPKKNNSGPLPPPMAPPPKAGLELVTEDGPSTQPLGRLSPFAELPKAQLAPDSAPSSDNDHTIKPVLLGTPPAPLAPLPRPSPAMMNAETIPPPVALPRPSPAMMAAETIQGPAPAIPKPMVMATATEPLPTPRPSPMLMSPSTETITRMDAPAPHPSPLVFQASPRVFEMNAQHMQQQPSGPPGPMMATPTPAPLPSGPPAPLMSAPPAAELPSLPAPSEEAPPPRKSKLLIPLMFALAVAVAAVGGLYLARMTRPSPTKEAAKPSATPSSEAVDGPMAGGPGSGSTPPTSLTTTVDANQPDADSPNLEASSGMPATSASHRHHRPRPAAPPPSASASPAKSGNVYDPSLY